MEYSVLSASFRDPSGFMFEQDDVLFRQINWSYQENYNLLMQSGLYQTLVRQGYLVEHSEENELSPLSDDGYKVIRPALVDFISYPYEWSFSQLKDAALLTLEIQSFALEHDMSLKDASAYNIQFHQGRPIMIDTLSFEKYEQGRPWTAYRQFCQHFFAPLALMATTDVRLNKLLLANIDGLPLDLSSRLLPRKTWLRPGLAMHLHIHARTQKAYSETDPDLSKKKSKARPISKAGLTGIIQGLYKSVAKLKCSLAGTEWGDYYNATNYSQSAFESKKQHILEFLERVQPDRVWDLGANTGVFSRIASEKGIPTICFDVDPAAVEVNYQRVREQKEHNLLPLLLDLTNPSPGLGWANKERDSLLQRGPVECILALALLHHLAIGNNVPFDKVASFLANLCKYLIIEFVPKEDSQVQRLLASREDIFTEYDQEHFEQAFAVFFHIRVKEPIADSQRMLYLMEKRNL